LDITSRSCREKILAAEISTKLGATIPEEEVLIDVPEPFSLETGLYVRNEERCFAHSSSAFTPDTAQSFIKSLSVIRIFTHPRHEESMRSCKELDGVLQLSGKWLE
jgi:hypothetical protein